MPTLPVSRHAVPAIAAVLLSLLIGLLSAGGALDAKAGSVSAEAVSVTARAAQNVATPGDQAFPVDGPAFAAAQRVATSHWGAAACNGQVTTRWAAMDEGTNATASWRNPTDAWNNAGANYDCIIELNPKADYDFAKLCTVLAHELGHLVGKPHADAEGQLMSAVYTTALPACENAAPARAAAPAQTTERVTATPAAKPAATKTFTKRTLRKPTRRCVWRFTDGKRTKRCITTKRTTATKPASTRR